MQHLKLLSNWKLVICRKKLKNNLKNCICCLCSLLVLCKSVHALDCIYNVQCTLYIFCSFTVHCAVSLYSVQWYCTLHSMIILAVGLFVRIALHRWCEIFQTFKEHTTAKHKECNSSNYSSFKFELEQLISSS